MPGRLADFAIIGAMKAGTSSLHEQLRLRSGIFMSMPKEPNFFSDDEHFARGLDWYASLFAGAGPRQICGESSTHYTKVPTYPRTVERMRRLLPRARFVYVLRHPIERMISQYIHEWSQREIRGPLERALLREERFVAYSSYARQLEPYLDAYGQDRILLVAFERLVAHPEIELARVCRFLGDPSPEPPTWSLQVAPKNVSGDRMRRSPLRDAFLARREVRTVKAWAPRSWRNAVKAFWQIRRRPTLRGSLRAELEAQVDEDLERLNAWLGTQLTCRTWETRALQVSFDWPIPGMVVR